MPSYISKGGEWVPAKEKAVNIRTGDVYEGPDREASKEIQDAGGRMGMKSNEDPENIMRARQLGISVDELLALNAPPKSEVDKANQAKEDMVVTHQLPPKKQQVRTVSGGTTIRGNFGDPPQV